MTHGELEALVRCQGDLIVRMMFRSSLACAKCKRIMEGSLTAGGAWLTFKCHECGAEENFVHGLGEVEKVSEDELREPTIWDCLRRIEALEKRESAENIARSAISMDNPTFRFLHDMSRPRTCSTCRWYSGGTENGRNAAERGCCQRRPPSQKDPSLVREAVFPQVMRHFFCGDHEFWE
ncbi:MAG: hypothetical protein ABFE13_11570 [Phycisphaerales bacterium]